MTMTPSSTGAPLRVAVPNKGSLATSATEMLREAGYRQRSDSKELTLLDTENGVEFFYLRPRDIALYVGAGTLDVGITGRDLLLDSGAKAEEVLKLGFGRSRFRFAARPGELPDLDHLAGKRIATSYVGLVRRHLEERGVEAEVIRRDGAVETSIQLGVADVVADVVETGSTLHQAGLAIIGDVVLESEAVLVTRSDAPDPEGFEVFRRRIDGVLVARSYVMMDYDIPDGAVEQAVALTPGIESPTVSPLHREGWVAVR
jgi:ATP phosphoribosyltransferase